MQMEVRTLARTGATKARYVWLMILAATVILFGGTAYGQQDLSGQQNVSSQSGQQDLSEISKELTNPVSNVWSMFTEFDLFFSDGNIKNTGGSKVGGRMIFQPVLPIPLYGEGRISGNSSPVPLYLKYSASPFRGALTTLRTWAVLATPSCPCWSRLRQGIGCSAWGRPCCYRQLPEPNSGDSRWGPDRRL